MIATRPQVTKKYPKSQSIGGQIDAGHEDDHRADRDHRAVDHVLSLENRRDTARISRTGGREVDPVGEGRPEGEHHRADVEPDDHVVELDRERRHARHPTRVARRNRPPSHSSATHSPRERSPTTSSPPARRAALTAPTSLESRPEQTIRRGGTASREAIPVSSGAVRFATSTGAGGGSCSRRLSRRSSMLDAVGRRVVRRRVERRRLAVAPAHRREPQLRRGDRQHARPGAEVGERTARLAGVGELEQQLQAHPGGCVGPGAKRLPGIDNDVHEAFVGRGGLPGRPYDDPPAGDRDGLVEVAPPIGPVVGDLGRADLDQALAGGRSELGHGRHLSGWPVDRVLDPTLAPLLLDPSRRQLQQLGEHGLRELGAAADGEPDHSSSDSCRR